MLFSSVIFIGYFLPLVMLLHTWMPGRNLVLLTASLLFYAWSGPAFLLILLYYIVFNWLVGWCLAHFGRSRGLVATGIVGNLGPLLVWKYAGFIFAQVNALAGWSLLPVPEFALPLGISFFTFQGVSYIVDVYRGTVAAQRSILLFAMYKSMFPQLIAGPILRYRDIAARVEQRRTSALRWRHGIMLFIVGLSQKVLIANTVALPADQIFGLPPGQLTLATAWFGAVCYMVQIFFDFGGYSTMAIGLGHMLGFAFPANFNRPYTAQSITEFWRRWHMTLSSWFRDYVYIPLGGNRGGQARVARNLLVVFVLCGFWHGAAWTFLAWGLFHGVLLMLERGRLGRWMAAAWRPVRHLYLLLAVLLGWVLFRADSLPRAGEMLGAMLGLGVTAEPLLPVAAYAGWPVLAALGAAVACTVLRLPRGRGWVAGARAGAATPGLLLARDLASYGALLVLLVASLSTVASGSYNPFIYFRF